MDSKDGGEDDASIHALAVEMLREVVKKTLASGAEVEPIIPGKEREHGLYESCRKIAEADVGRQRKTADQS